MTTTLLLDDEPHALELLEYHLRIYPELKIVERCMSLTTAMASIRQYRPQLVFLDIEVNRQEVYPLLEEMALLATRPAIIFVTAHAKKHMERILESCSQRFVYSYLSKPIEVELLAEAMARYFTNKGANAPASLPVGVGNSRYLVTVSNIVYAAAAGNYADVHYEERGVLRRAIFNGSLTTLEKTLPVHPFHRISNKHLINTKRLRGTEKNHSVCLLTLTEADEAVRLHIPEKRRGWFRGRL